MFGRVQGFLGSRCLLQLWYILGLVLVLQEFGFERMQSFFVLGVGLGCLKCGRIQSFLGFRGLLLLGYILGLVTVVEGLGYFGVQSGFALRVGQGCLRFGRVQRFLGFRGLLQLGYILGLVTVYRVYRVYLRVSYGQLRLWRVSVILGSRMVSHLGLARVVLGLVGFRVFQGLEVFCSQGISQGQLQFCRVLCFGLGLGFFCILTRLAWKNRSLNCPFGDIYAWGQVFEIITLTVYLGNIQDRVGFFFYQNHFFLK